MIYLFNIAENNENLLRIKVLMRSKVIYLRVIKYLPIIKILIPDKYDNLTFFVNDVEVKPIRATKCKRSLKKPDLIKVKDTNFKHKDIKLNIGGNQMQFASISPKQGKIFLNNKFCDLPLFWQIFIIYHEFGHLYYRDEIKADTFAFWNYINNGYPESQAVLCYYMVLNRTNDNLQRIKNLLKLEKWKNTKNI